MKLPDSEEKLMELLWQNGPAYLKDILAAYPEPKPAKTTVATLLSRLRKRGAVDFKTYGNSREYFAVLPKATYFGGQLRRWIDHFFGASPTNFASFFTDEADLTQEQLAELRDLIDRKMKK